MKGRDLAANNIVASAVWRNYIKQIWAQHCSLDSTNDNFWPHTFFDSESEKWFTKSNIGSWDLCYDETDNEWNLKKRTSDDEDSNSRSYLQMDNAPY